MARKLRRRWLAALACCVQVGVVVLGWGAGDLPFASASATRIPVGDALFKWRTVTLPSATGGAAASFAEPGIAFGPRRTAIVNAADANAGVPPTWWISRDDGRRWSAGRDLDLTGTMTGDADAAIGVDGYFYALNLGYEDPPRRPANPTVLVFASPDGRAWHGPAAYPLPHGVDQPDRPWLVTDPYHPERVYVTNSEGAGDVVLWRSTDHARTFSGPTLVTGLKHAVAVELTSRPMFDSVHPDRMYMVYAASAPTGLIPQIGPPTGKPLQEFPLTQLWLARSDDAGRSWSNRLILDMVEAYGSAARGGSLAHVLPAAAIDRSGTLYAAFSLRLGTSTETHVYLIHSSDHGLSWSGPTRVDSGGLGSNVMPALVAGSRGRVDLSWYGSTSPDFTSPSATWAVMFAQVVNAAGGHPTIKQGRVSGSRPVFTGGINTSGNIGSNLYDWSLRDFQSIGMDSCGMAHLAWASNADEGSTVTSTQTAGGSLLPGTCA